MGWGPASFGILIEVESEEGRCYRSSVAICSRAGKTRGGHTTPVIDFWEKSDGEGGIIVRFGGGFR
jgi:hypothetical protein